MVVLYMAVSILRREDDVHIFGRRMENDVLRRACSIVVVYVVMGIASTLAICGMQTALPLRDVLLEVFSAMDTVGMSTGITRELTNLSRVIIVLLMYAGRLGSLTFAILLTNRSSRANVQYPAEKLIVG